MHRIKVEVFEDDRPLWSGDITPPLEVGRQAENDRQAMELQTLSNCSRLVIAPVTARGMPRKAIRIESPTRNEIRVINVHDKLPFTMGDGNQVLRPVMTT